MVNNFCNAKIQQFSRFDCVIQLIHQAGFKLTHAL